MSFKSLEVSFYKRLLIDWPCIRNDYQRKNRFFRKGDLSKPLLSRAGLAILCWWHCCQGQVYCWPSDGCTTNACRLQTWFVAENAKFFFAAGVTRRQTVRVGWVAERSWWQEVAVLPFTRVYPPSRVTRAFYCYRPKISVTAVWPRWRKPSLTFTSHPKNLPRRDLKLNQGKKKRLVQLGICIFFEEQSFFPPCSVHRLTFSVATPNNLAVYTVLPQNKIIWDEYGTVIEIDHVTTHKNRKIAWSSKRKERFMINE